MVFVTGVYLTLIGWKGNRIILTRIFYHLAGPASTTTSFRSKKGYSPGNFPFPGETNEKGNLDKLTLILNYWCPRKKCGL